MRYIHLGIDYGTSATKVVVRDYGAAGGELAHPLRWSTGSKSDFRLPSWVATTSEHAWFGVRPGGPGDPGGRLTWHQSLKMRVAAQVAGKGTRAEVYAQSLPNLNLPGGWGYRELLVASLVWVLCRAKEKSAKVTKLPVRELKFGVTFGLPTDFRHDRNLAACFLTLYRAAFSIARDRTFCERWFPAPSSERRPNPIKLAQDLLRRLENELRSAEQQSDADADYWHQSEARASVLWAWHSPAFSRGSYLHVDIGAGTTNVVGYLVREQFERNSWVKTGISVISSASGPIGFDAVAADVRRIGDVLKQGNNALKNGFQEPYRRVFGDIRRLTHGAGQPWQQWSNARIVLLGGGTHLDGLANAFLFHPFTQADLEALDLADPPHDLDLGLSRALGERDRLDAHRDARHTLAIAYGLSVPGVSLPGERTPDQIPPLEPPRTTPHETLAGIYAR